jgi:hypothetical protein
MNGGRPPAAGAGGGSSSSNSSTNGSSSRSMITRSLADEQFELWGKDTRNFLATFLGKAKEKTHQTRVGSQYQSRQPSLLTQKQRYTLTLTKSCLA